MAVPGTRTPEMAAENEKKNYFASREEASLAAAQFVAAAAVQRLESDGEAALVVTGGTSPVQCYAELSQMEMNWSNVCLFLSDERWVPPDSADSNEKLLRDTLLIGKARDASLFPIYQEGVDISQRCESLDRAISSLKAPFACSLLGMGEDGHFASLFPDAVGLDVALSVNGPDCCMPVITAASEHERLSLTVSALTRSDSIALLFFGAAKRNVYEKAQANTQDYPVTKLLHQERAPVHVFWAP